MSNEIQRAPRAPGAIQITSDNWQNALAALPVKADSSPADVLRMGTPAISLLNRGTGSTALGEIIFEGVLYGVLVFFGVNCKAEGMKSVLMELGQMAHAQFHFLHFAELKHFATQAKAGVFNTKESWSMRDLDGYITGKEEWDGKIYGQLTPALLLKWLDRYAGESLKNRALLYGDSRPAIEAKDEDASAVYVDPALVAQALNWKEQLLAIKTPDELDADEQERRRQERLARRRAEFFGTVAEPEPVTPSPPPATSADSIELEMQIWDFCDRLIAGEPTNSREDVQFYANNKAAIEAELQERRGQQSQSNPNT